MPTISLCMIVRDEAAVLERCLQSVAHLVDEIIIVDTGSIDETKTIAATFTPHLYEFPWQDDFSAARNFAFSKGTGDYLFWMDADDVLPPESQQQFLERKPYFQADMIVMPYYAALDAQNQPLFTFERERLMRQTINGKGRCTKSFRFGEQFSEKKFPSGTKNKSHGMQTETCKSIKSKLLLAFRFLHGNNITMHGS